MADPFVERGVSFAGRPPDSRGVGINSATREAPSGYAGTAGEIVFTGLIVEKGYSITLKNGKAVTDASQLLPGDEVTTRVAKGEFKSKVI